MNGLDLARLERVDVERDVDALGPSSAASSSSASVRRPIEAMNSRSGGSRLRAPSRIASCGSTAPESRITRNGVAQRFPEGELSAVFRSPCASIQTSAIRPLRAASASTAPMCEQQQPPSTSGRSGRSIATASVCSSSVSSSTTAASGNGSGRRAASAIDSPPSPQACGTRTSPAPNSRPQAWHS